MDELIVQRRKRYPAKISIVHVPQELRDRLDTLLDKNPGASEAEIVRQALDKYLPKKGK